VDGAVLAEEDLEDDAVDGVVLAVEGDGADCGARLAVTIDAALALLVAGGVPGEVVVEDGVEGVLEVDALGEAVGADEDAAIGLGEASDAIFSLFRGELAGDRFDGDPLGEVGAELLGEVVGGGDEAAEEDGGVASVEELADEGGGALQLVVLGGAGEGPRRRGPCRGGGGGGRGRRGPRSGRRG
jgi:hypothetical protein